MQISKPYTCKNAENESQEVIRFDKSLQELKDLRSQLHYAANYCETTFLNAKQKKMNIVENTKEYVCMAMVAVVDHLGCVSANLNSSINSKTTTFSDAELRINCLKQRLLSCEKYAHKLALTKVRWSANLPKFHRRYLSTQISSVEKSHEDASRNSNSPASTSTKKMDRHGFEAKDSPGLFLCTNTTVKQKSPSPKNLSSVITCSKKGETSSSKALPVHDGLSILSRSANPAFHFQQCSPKHGRKTVVRQSSARSNDILSLLRRTKRAAL